MEGVTALLRKILEIGLGHVKKGQSIKYLRPPLIRFPFIRMSVLVIE